MQNKRGQGLSTSTIILLILGVLILVILILGFAMGWGKLKETIFGAGGGDSNVDQVSQACQLACTTRSTYDFCSRERILKASDLPDEAGKKIKEKTSTCNFFSSDSEYVKYSIRACPDITCP